MYNVSIWGGSWGTGCCRRERFRRWRRCRRCWTSRTVTLKSGLACQLIWYIICLCRSASLNSFDHVSMHQSCQFKSFPSEAKKKAQCASIILHLLHILLIYCPSILLLKYLSIYTLQQCPPQSGEPDVPGTCLGCLWLRIGRLMTTR